MSGELLTLNSAGSSNILTKVPKSNKVIFPLVWNSRQCTIKNVKNIKTYKKPFVQSRVLLQAISISKKKMLFL